MNSRAGEAEFMVFIEGLWRCVFDCFQLPASFSAGAISRIVFSDIRVSFEGEAVLRVLYTFLLLKSKFPSHELVVWRCAK